MPFAASEPLRDTKLSRLRRSLARPLTRFVGIDVGVEYVRVVSLVLGIVMRVESHAGRFAG